MTALKVTRINPGIYDVATPKGAFELEKMEGPYGGWCLYEVSKTDPNRREYCNDFNTKRHALASLQKGLGL